MPCRAGGAAARSGRASSGRAVGEHDDAVGEVDRLLDRVGHEHDGLAVLGPDPQQLVLDGCAGSARRERRTARPSASPAGRGPGCGRWRRAGACRPTGLSGSGRKSDRPSFWAMPATTCRPAPRHALMSRPKRMFCSTVIQGNRRIPGRPCPVRDPDRRPGARSWADLARGQRREARDGVEERGLAAARGPSRQTNCPLGIAAVTSSRATTAPLAGAENLRGVLDRDLGALRPGRAAGSDVWSVFAVAGASWCQRSRPRCQRSRGRVRRDIAPSMRSRGCRSSACRR